MHPALSVIIFTVSSGAGLGLLALCALFGVFEAGGGLTPAESLLSGGIGLLLTTVGLVSSAGHLANPKNAWRAFNRFRTSWLSREAVFAVLLYPFALSYFGVVGVWDRVPEWLISGLGIATALIALATIFCTGMIYACLRTIRQWNTSLVPTNYLLLGLALGAMLLTAILAVTKGAALDAAAALALIALSGAGLGKVIYYFWIGQPEGPTINTATGFTRAAVRLFESGESVGGFLNKEFGFRAPSGRIAKLRLTVYGLAFGLPIVLSGLLLTRDGGAALAMLAVVCGFAGVGVERWLFFAEARHVVNLFYGAQRT